MLHVDAKKFILLATGNSGSGKSTFVIRWLANARLSCRFLFDPEGEFADRLGLAAAESPQEMEQSVADGWMIYDPHAMFPGKLPDAFDFFCQWSFDTASRLPGNKAVLVDEVWKYCKPQTIPDPLANIIQTGRKRQIQAAFCTQRPNRLNEAITNEVDELVCFRLQGQNALKSIEHLGADPDEVSTLPPGAYVSQELNRGTVLRGRLW